jgi:hypothetical protein
MVDKTACLLRGHSNKNALQVLIRRKPLATDLCLNATFESIFSHD